jgi:hypothetical protein
MLRVRPLLQNANPKTNATKLQPIIQAKYREYQEQLTIEGRISTVVKKSTSRSSTTKLSTPTTMHVEKTVAPIKIRISARKKRRNDDSDDDNGM